MSIPVQINPFKSARSTFWAQVRPRHPAGLLRRFCTHNGKVLLLLWVRLIGICKKLFKSLLNR